MCTEPVVPSLPRGFWRPWAGQIGRCQREGSAMGKGWELGGLGLRVHGLLCPQRALVSCRWDADPSKSQCPHPASPWGNHTPSRGCVKVSVGWCRWHLCAWHRSASRYLELKGSRTFYQLPISWWCKVRKQIQIVVLSLTEPWTRTLRWGLGTVMGENRAEAPALTQLGSLGSAGIWVCGDAGPVAG